MSSKRLILILFTTIFLSSMSMGAQIIRGPYLSCPTQTGMVVSWQTDSEVPSKVCWGLSASYTDSITINDKVKIHHVELSDLDVSTEYHYKVVSSNAESQDFTFTTAPTKAESCRFIVYGDTRTDHKMHQTIVNHLIDDKANLFLHVGDLIERGYNDSLWTVYFDVTRELGALAPIMYAPGNHEDLDKTNNYYDYFYLFHNNPENTEAYYSFDYGSSHIISLNSNEEDNVIRIDPGSPQYTWLENDLIQAQGKHDFIFVFFHHPPYNSDKYEINIRKYFCPLFSKYNVDVVFSGDAHGYERTRPIDNVVYVTTAGGGASLGSKKTDNEWSQKYERTFNYVDVEINGLTADLTMIRQDGTIGDFFSIDKSGAKTKQPRKCILVFGAHADDVEQMGGGTLVKYLDEGYKGVYVCVTNNTAGCIIDKAPGKWDFVKKVTLDESPAADQTFPSDGLETIQVRKEEAIQAASVLGLTPIFLNFRETWVWHGRQQAYIGTENFRKYDPPGGPPVSFAHYSWGYNTPKNENLELVLNLLRKYQPEVTIIHALGGEKHDHGNSAYLMYLAFKKAISEGVPVGKLWMKTNGWLLGTKDKPNPRGIPDVKIDITDYRELQYKALDKHLSQNGASFKADIKPGQKIYEKFITVLDNTKNLNK